MDGIGSLHDPNGRASYGIEELPQINELDKKGPSGYNGLDKIVPARKRRAFWDGGTLKFDENTDIGGVGRTFQTTHWTAIEGIKSEDDTHKRALIGDLLNMYWKPVYCYLRRKGYGNETAKDLTQGFFQEVVLSRELIQQADQARGRFRTLLLTALDRYLTSEYRKQAAQKRIPKERLVRLDHVDPGELPEVLGGLSSEESFNYAWISELLDQMLSEVKAECSERGMAGHWKAFYARVLKPIIEGREPTPMAQICDECGIEDPIKASNMIVAVKRRFQATLRRHLRQSVASEAQISEEMRELVRFLTKKTQ